MRYFLSPLALLLASVSTNVLAVSPIRIDHAYSYPTAAPGVPGVGFFSLSNTGTKADRLLAASSSVAGSIEIHQSSVANGVMQMRALKQGLPLPAGKTVAFAPGGLHLMLFALQTPLAEGQRVPVTLTFERAGAVTTEFLVESREPVAPADSHGQHQH